jgi:hypothetical protein
LYAFSATELETVDGTFKDVVVWPEAALSSRNVAAADEAASLIPADVQLFHGTVKPQGFEIKKERYALPST